MNDIFSEIEDIARALARIPVHLLAVFAGLLLVVGSDRTAATFFIAGTIMVLCWGWGTAAILIAVYGVLIFAQQIAQAFLGPLKPSSDEFPPT